MRWLFVCAVLLATPAILVAENRTSEKLLTRRSIAERLISPLSSPAPRPVAFREVIRSSAMIFAGTVLRVEHLRADPGSSVEITQISFRVETAIRGTRSRQLIQIREWEGLWNAGERYTPGEKVLLFLYPNSKLGLTSPVGGPAGRFEVDAKGRVKIAREHVFHRQGVPESEVDTRAFAREIRRAARE
jgi:hypothetical protein